MHTFIQNYVFFIKYSYLYLYVSPAFLHINISQSCALMKCISPVLKTSAKTEGVLNIQRFSFKAFPHAFGLNVEGGKRKIKT